MKSPHLIILIYILFLILTSCGEKKEANAYAVHKGKFEASITETGDLQAINARLITMPYVDWRFSYEFKIIALKDNGTPIKKGDTVAIIDNTSAQKAIDDMQTRFDSEQATLNKLYLNYIIREQEVKTDLSIKEANYTAAKIQVEKSKFDTEKKQKVRQYELEKATISLNLSKERLKTVLASAQKQIKIQKIRLRRMESDIKYAKTSLNEFVLRSPGNGILQISRNRENGMTYKVGDKIYRGSEIASVPDLSQMKVLATINETDISKITLNQPVIIRLDAYSSVPFEGTVSNISKICHLKDQESTRKVFDFEVTLRKNDPLLKPGMTVGCEIFYAKLKDAVYVNNDCIHFTDSSQFVILQDGKKKCNIKLGPGNNLYTTVIGDLPIGAELIPYEKTTSKKIN